jgi:hypothetical protein
MKTHIKIMYSIMGVTAGAALLFVAGCSKQEQPASDTTKTTTPAASEAPKPAARQEAAPPAEPATPAVAAGQATTPAAEAAKPAAAASQATQPTPDATQPAASASPAAAPAAAEAQKAADAATTSSGAMKPALAAATQQAVSAATNQAGAAVAATTNQTQALIEKAKGLVTDQKYKDALTVVQQLASVKLTPEQRTLVDGLKAQIQTALAKDAASDATSALGNVLGGKK